MFSPFPKNVSVHFTTKAGGVSLPPYASNNLGLHVEDNPLHVLHNRQRLKEQLGLDAIQWLNQVHGTKAVPALPLAKLTAHAAGLTDKPDLNAINKTILTADALYSQQHNLACAILTADCLPVLFAAQDGSQVAAAHAGWRGLADGVLHNTLNTFKEPNNVIVCFGAAISQAAFEVGPEVKAAFPWASDACFNAGRAGKYYANIYQLAFEQLQQAGVTEIYQTEFCGSGCGSSFNPTTPVPCTFTQQDLFYSYRRNKKTGRMASLIWINS